MSDRRNLFPMVSTTTTTSPVVADVGEISLRDEIQSFLSGGNGEIPKGQTFILRRARRDSNGNIQSCICVDSVTNEPDKDYFRCPFCLGIGYYIDEELITGYKVIVSSLSGNIGPNFPQEDWGWSSIPSVRFYFAYDAAITLEDKIVEIELGMEGTPVLPYNRLSTYNLLLLREMRGDRGRVEYWVCHGQKLGIKTQSRII